MATKTSKKLGASGIDGLLSQIGEKKKEVGKAPLQVVQPVGESNAVNTSKWQNKNMPGTPKIGKPTVKEPTVEYVKMSPRIPKALKKQMDIAIVEERYVDIQGRPVKTIDEFVAVAVDRMLAAKK